MGRPKKLKLKEEKKRKGKPIQSVDGMNDILPQDQNYWDFVLETSIKVMKPFGFQKIDTPLLEKIELFTKSINLKDDFVLKEMFNFKNIDKENLALRPNLMVGICRAYIENSMSSLSQPVKLYSFGPVFRNKKNILGELRQSHQLYMGIIGKDGAIIDTQIIFLILKILNKIGLGDLKVQINSLGCELCIDEYKKVLSEYVFSKKNKLCANCKNNFKENYFKIFYCKNDKCQSILENAPEVVDFLCEECNNYFKNILEYLDDLGIAYNLNSKVTNRSDYYTGTVFEIWSSEVEGDSHGYPLVEGGRYNDLISNLEGNRTPAMGAVLYLERIVDLIKKKGIKIPDKKYKPDVLLIQLGSLAKRKALKIFDEIIDKGINARESLHKDSIKSQLRLAENLGVKFAVILGQKEILDRTILIRDMRSGIQEIISLDKVIPELKKRLKNSKKNN